MKSVAFAAAALAGVALADSWDSWDPSTTTTTTSASWGSAQESWYPKHKYTTSATTTTSSSSSCDWETVSWMTKATTTSSVCPPYTATTPPAWFSELPSSVASSLEASLTAAPSDWCLYTPVSPATTTMTSTSSCTGWATIPGVTTVTATSSVCPSYTATTPPAWFSELPSSILSSIEASFTSAPSDWCLYTPVAAVTTSSSSTCTATVTMTGWQSASSSTTTTTTYVTVTSTWAAGATDSWEEDPGMCSVSVYTSTGDPTWSPDASWTSYSTIYVSAIPSTTSSAWASPSSSSSEEWAWPTTTSSSDGSETWAWTSSSSSSPSSETWAWSSSSSDGSSTETWAWSSSASSSSASATWSASSSATWSSASASSSPTGGSAPIAPSGNQWAMTYSPYTSSGGCTDQGTIASDIANIAAKGFTSVRVYSTDCNTLQYVGDACKNNGLKLILGIFISDTGISGAQGQLTDILAWAQWDIVELIVVGNEAVFNSYCSASDLAGFISSVKSQCSGAGYTGPVTTTEPLSTWQSDGQSFCSVVDVVAGNLYAFFNAQTTADQAGSFIQSEIGILEGICSGKEVYVMESGWPSAGQCNGVACPGTSEQATAIKGIQSTSGAKVVFFSYEDDEWKAPGEYDVEQHWGCAGVFSGGW